MLFESGSPWQNLAAALGLAAAVAYALADLAARLTRLALLKTTGPVGAEERRGVIDRPVRWVRGTVFALGALALSPPALELAGVPVGYGLAADGLVRWVFNSGLRVALIGAFAFLVVRVSTTLVGRFERALSQGEGVDALERAKRARTLAAVIESGVVIVVVGVALLTILRELDVDITPVLTAAGVGGLAVGFGAQTLVKDVISGFFLLLENQVRVGDVAIINGTSGLVEAINLRTIVLRDLEGVVHIFPNGSVTTLANRTREFSYALIDLGVAYREDLDRVFLVLREVGDELASDPRYQPQLLGPLEILGVDGFGDSQVTIKLRIKTVPLKQWEVGRELRRRIKTAFDRHGIEIPFPHRTIYWGEGSPPWRVRVEREPR